LYNEEKEIFMKLIILVALIVAVLGVVAVRASATPPSKTYKVSFYKDVKGEFRWNVAHRNTNIVADSGEGYKNHIDCRNSFANLAAGLKTSNYNVSIFLDSKGEQRWRITHKNGKIVADSGESYKNLIDCVTSLNNLISGLSKGEYDTVDSVK
jgi:uncharacterized protein YegP (UPF0339 family)